VDYAKNVRIQFLDELWQIVLIVILCSTCLFSNECDGRPQNKAIGDKKCPSQIQTNLSLVNMTG
jgi:hypothetical protein